jgi:Fic family protein
MGYLAHGHPFLDGNGRTIMVLHCVLAQRAGFGQQRARTIIWPLSPRNLKTPIKDI